MDSTEIIRQEQQFPSLPQDIAQSYAQMAQAMRAMADMMRATNERMTALEQQVRLLTKVTPAQAEAINAEIRARASELCATYHLEGDERDVAGMIRREVRTMHGVRSMRDLPRCDYAVVVQQVRLWVWMWNEYKAMKAKKAKGGKE